MVFFAGCCVGREIMASKELEFISVDQDDDDEAQYGMDQAYGQATAGSSSSLSTIENALGSAFFSQSKVRYL